MAISWPIISPKGNGGAESLFWLILNRVLQTAIPYTIILPDGASRVVGPDSSEHNFLAHLVRITSDVAWDSSDSQIAAGDGSLIGSMYRGTRTVVLDLLIAEHDAMVRADKIEWIQRINGLLRNTTGVTLTWKEATGFDKVIQNLRPTSYISVGDDWPKTLQIVLRTGDPFIRSVEVHSREINDESGTTDLFNAGNAPAAPVFYVYGPCDDFSITNSETGQVLVFQNQIDDGDYIQIDTRKRTVLLNGGQNAYGGLDFNSSEFFKIPPLAPSVPLVFGTSGGGANTKLTARWQSAWE